MRCLKVCRIALVGAYRDTALLRQLSIVILCFVGNLEVTDSYMASSLCILRGDRLADTTCCSGDQSHFVLK